MNDLKEKKKAQELKIRKEAILRCAIACEKAKNELPPNRKRLDKEVVDKLINEAREIDNTITYYNVRYVLDKRKEKGSPKVTTNPDATDTSIYLPDSVEPPTDIPLVSDESQSTLSMSSEPTVTQASESQRKKGGGSKSKKRKHLELTAFAYATNEACQLAWNDKVRYKKEGKQLPNHHIEKIIKKVSTLRNLTKDRLISVELVRKRLYRYKQYLQGNGSKKQPLLTNGKRGTPSPLEAIEPAIVEFIIRLGRMRDPPSVGKCKALINSLIKQKSADPHETSIQKKLIDFKRSTSHSTGDDEIDGQIGRGYWAKFLERNAHLIQTKKGEKFELNRALWTTFANMLKMYDRTSKELVDEAKVAVELDDPVWMNEKGEEVEEKDAVGCKVTIDITHPEYCIVADEVGGDTCQLDDGHVGGERMVCEAGTRPQTIANSKAQHFTVLGLTLLTGEPLMCVVIFSGKTPKDEIELGYDETAPLVGDPSDDDFMKNNIGPGKRYPGGPTCTYKGKKIPCMCRWSENGSITSDILAQICETLDVMKIFDRSEGRLPFFLLDGHGSRFELPFLSYINNDSNKWVVCIGVPYGTSVWQVGDSKEQNGQFKILLSEFKRILMERRRKNCINIPTIDSTDIIPMINYAFPGSFGNVETNKKAISDRGLNPYNRILLLEAAIRATMTPFDIENEKKDPSIIYPSHALESLSNRQNSEPNFDSQYAPNANCQYQLNFDNNTSQSYLDKLIRHEDRQAALGRIAKDRQEGKLQETEASKLKRMSAGVVWNDMDTNRCGQEVYDRQLFKAEKKVEAKLVGFDTAKNNFIKMNHEAFVASNIPEDDWKPNEYKCMIRPLRRKGDAPWSKLNTVEELRPLYNELHKGRSPLSFEDHLRYEKPNVVIPNSVDMATLDLTVNAHPRWNGVKFEPAEKKTQAKKRVKTQSNESTAL